MFVTMPFMCRVVSVHRLNTATCSGLIRTMSCSSVSEVKDTNSPERCAWMSCHPQAFIRVLLAARRAQSHGS